MKNLRNILFLSSVFLLTGCKYAILDPKGSIATSEKNLFLIAVALMLVVVIPVIILSVYIPWKYRSTNTKAKYDPTWAHSYLLEAIWWAIPCIIIGILAVLTWIYTHRLDPYRPLNNPKKPLIIEAVALNWKWLFIYPEQHIAVVNYLFIPTDRPIRFYITSDAPMNSLEIPRLAGQIYAMAGMQTKLNLIANEAGLYRGFSSNFSGDGFSQMYFNVKADAPAAFDAWVQSVKGGANTLSPSVYATLAKDSENNPVTYYSTVENQLFEKIIMKYAGMQMAGMGSAGSKLVNE